VTPKFSSEEIDMMGGIKSIHPQSPDDIILLCASYEPRSLATTQALAPSYRAKRGLIYVNREFLSGPAGPMVNRNLEILQGTLTNKCDLVEIIQGSWLDPKIQLTELRHYLQKTGDTASSKRRTTIDITTFNREALIVAVALLLENSSPGDIRAVYVSPQDHGAWLSRGFRLVRNVMGFAGTQQPSKNTILAVLSGFEPERTAKIIEEHEPSKVLLGLGDPPTDTKFLERNRLEQHLVLARQEVADFCFPADSINDCAHCLREVLFPYIGKSNVIIAPMSTKLSTLAALLVAYENPDIQLTYCVPGEYNIEDYSRGSKAFFLESLSTYETECKGE